MQQDTEGQSQTAGTQTQANSDSFSLTSGDPKPIVDNNSGQKQQASVPEWKAALPEDLRSEPSLELINDIETLSRNYINTKKLVGKDKIPIPSKHATEEEWRAAFQKLGLPEDLNNYKSGLDDKLAENGFDPELYKNVKEAAFKLNILPHQFDGFMKSILDISASQQKASKESIEASEKEALGNLQKEWGQAFDVKFNLAKTALKNFADEKDIDFLEKSGLSKMPEMIRIFAKIGQEYFSEGKFKGDGITEGYVRLTPAEAKRKIDDMRLDPALLDKSHPKHKNALDEYTRLHQMAFPG